MPTRSLAPALLALGALVGASVAAGAEGKLPASIQMKTAGFLPEGVEYDTRNKRFLVGSLAQGTVFVVGNDGTLTPFIQDPDLTSSVGIEVDEERNRLLVANSDRAVFGGQAVGQAKLGIYALDTGKRLAMVDLAAVGPSGARSHFANDVAVGPDGSAYVTNSMARVVYKVNPQYKASVFHTFAGEGRLMLNGIVAHPDGYLLVAESATGDLYKVPLDNPANTSKVKLDEPITGGDGMVWHPDGYLIVVRNDKSQSVVALRSQDNWASAAVGSRAPTSAQATTAALTDEGVYAVQPFFNDPKALPVLERVHLK